MSGDSARATKNKRKARANAGAGSAASVPNGTVAVPTAAAVTQPDTPSAGPAACSADDAAMLLVQLEPSNLVDVIRVRDMLRAVGAGPGLPESAVALLERAATRVEDMLMQSAADQQASQAEAGRLLEAAMAAIETGGQVPAPAAAPPPAPAAGPAPGWSAATGSEPFQPAEALDTELLADFIVESRDYASASEAALLELEVDPSDTEAINTVFRAFHTVKGTSAFLGLEPITEFAHHAESLFDRFRAGELRCAGPLADLSLRAVDLLKALLGAAERAATEGLKRPQGYDALLAILADPAAVDRLATGEGAGRLGDILVGEGAADRAAVEAVEVSRDAEPLGIALVKAEAASLGDVAQALRKQQRVAETADATVRVRTDRLDSLVDMVGELVIAQSMISQDTAVAGGGDGFVRKVTHAAKIVRELQGVSVSMRMVPLRPTFQKMARLVRDVARKSGKQVRFETEGEDTEIDRSMVDVIGDPLVHMIRNAVDHGIESPEARAAAGKEPDGLVRLHAYHSGGNVVVELRDDGRGLDRERILRKAVAKGLVNADRAMTDSEIFNLIFAPGFSTAEQVTDLSGRGVGMDVVRRGVEALRGRIDISSEPGQGSTFSLRLPLTLAVTDGMLVRVAGERYIVPTVNIDMSFRPQPSALFTVTGRGEVVLHRDELLPLVRLHRLFEIRDAVEDPARALLVIVGFGERRCALLVDELLGQHQVVAKSLGDGIGTVDGISGGAILGDGRVGLILDAAELIQLAQRA